MKKILWAMILSCLLCVPVYSLVHAEGGKIDLTFKDERISAKIEEGSLRDIARRLKAEKRIRITGKESLMDEQVSVEFKNLSAVESLKRILFKMSYTLIFDQDGKVIEAMVFGKIEGVRPGILPSPPIRKRPARRVPRRTPKRTPSGR